MSGDEIIEIISQKLGEKKDNYMIPPPVFITMNGEFITFDLENGVLKTKFPVQEQFLNPFRSLQGGIVAAAVDNTFGPLSMLVAPPSVTRRIEMKYSRPVTSDLGYITVEAKFVKRDQRMLTFRADVRDPKGNLMAKAKALHWILDESEDE
ncbi:MAG: thioesterase [Anaerolineae bacterium SM23_ 63]|nr:MAG: thioesterase [Anaerolineae bacterium SM23_ 63]HEY47678.1 PaaI family thioesterase [Anaerolineae bacterium]